MRARRTRSTISPSLSLYAPAPRLLRSWNDLLATQLDYTRRSIHEGAFSPHDAAAETAVDADERLSHTSARAMPFAAARTSSSSSSPPKKADAARRLLTGRVVVHVEFVQRQRTTPECQREGAQRASSSRL